MDLTSVAICLVRISPQPDSRNGFQTPLLGPIMRLGTYTHRAKAAEKVMVTIHLANVTPNNTS